MVLDQLIAFYEGFSMDSIAKLGDVYHDRVCFKDPLHEINGLPALTAYFEHVCNNSVAFKITDAGELSASKAFLRWQMSYAHPSLSRGKPLMLEGASFVEGDSKIDFHQDYYDLGAMVYQHIPVVGFAIRKVNDKLRAGS